MIYMDKSRIHIIILTVAIVLIAKSARGDGVRKGSYEGPYIRFLSGVLFAERGFDDSSGNNIVGKENWLYGLEFGWNLRDQFALEMTSAYSTRKVTMSRRHIFKSGVNLKYSIITERLNARDIAILPFIKAGATALIAAIPEDPMTSSATNTIYGGGIAGGAGIDFLIYHHLYMGIGGNIDLVFFPSRYSHTNGEERKIISGGAKPMFAITGSLGVHF
jgi:hypothetical protein